MNPSFTEVALQAKRIELKTGHGVQCWHVWREGAGQPLVLLHGGSGSWTHWARNVLDLSQDREVWAVDLPGMGDSDLPLGALDAHDLHHPLEAGLQQLFGPSSLDMVGFSFGGLVLGYLAATHPERVKRMVMVGIPGLGLSNQITQMRGFREGMSQQDRRQVHQHNLQVLMLHDASMISTELLHQQEDNVVRDRLRRRRMARSDAMLGLQSRWQCPVHGVWGEHDALYKGKLEALKDRLTGCDLQSFHIVPNAGHWVQYEQPDAFNQILRRCLPVPKS